MLIAFALAGCRFPADPEGTLDRVEGRTLRVGLLVDRQVFAGTPEAAVVEGLADALAAEIAIETGSVHDLAARLEAGKIDLLAGQIPARTPFRHRLGLTSAWGEVIVDGEPADAVFAIRKGENAFLMALNRRIAAAPRP